MRPTAPARRRSLATLASDPRAAFAIAVVMGLLTVLWIPAGGSPGPEELWQAPLSGRDEIEHLLNRITFGPRPGDVERVERLGIATFLDRQLHPERLDDSAVEARIRTLPTLDMSSSELVESFPAPRRAREAGMMAADTGRPREILVELAREEIWRAVYGERQLEELMVQFWMNHFNIFAPKGADKWLLTSFERDTIRPHALGRFEDLLAATAKSPAMLFYLDNWLSAAPGAAAGFARNRRGLNENYARELMELHTLGVDGGYTQRDVTEVARAFTGWTIERPRRSPQFRFAPRLHDRGEKQVLGRRIAAGGMNDGLEVLALLAREPATARFVSTKLCRRFVADDPPPALVERASRTFLDTGGDLRAVLRTILTSREFSSRAAYRAKVKSPLELAASALRAYGGETDAGRPLLALLGLMGQPMFQFQSPAGYPDRAQAWIDPSMLLHRMKFAAALASGRLPGTAIQADPADAERIALHLASPEFQRR